MARRLWNRFLPRPFAGGPALTDAASNRSESGAGRPSGDGPVFDATRDEDIARAATDRSRNCHRTPGRLGVQPPAALHLSGTRRSAERAPPAHRNPPERRGFSAPPIQYSAGPRGTAEALATARENLASATFSDARSWALLFARLGHVKEADSLLQAFLAATATPGLLPDVLALRHSVMLRFGTLEEARAIFREAETSLTDHADQSKR